MQKLRVERGELTEASKPIVVIESSIRPVLTSIIVYGIRPRVVAPTKIENGTPTVPELAFRNQFGTRGVRRKNMK